MNFSSLDFFYSYLEEFLEDLLKTGLPLTKKINSLKDYYNDGNKVKTLELFNSSIKNYETRFFNVESDPNVLKRINNPIFFHLMMNKILTNPKMSEEDKQTVYKSLRTLYFYSELHCNPDRKDLKELGEKCRSYTNQVTERSSGSGDLDQRIDKATETVKKLLATDLGHKLAPGVDFSQFGDLIEKIGKGVGQEIKNNGGNIDTADILEKMKSGNLNSNDGLIGGINLKNIINSVNNVNQ